MSAAIAYWAISVTRRLNRLTCQWSLMIESRCLQHQVDDFADWNDHIKVCMKPCDDALTRETSSYLFRQKETADCWSAPTVEMDGDFRCVCLVRASSFLIGWCIQCSVGISNGPRHRALPSRIVHNRCLINSHGHHSAFDLVILFLEAFASHTVDIQFKTEVYWIAL